MFNKGEDMNNKIEFERVKRSIELLKNNAQQGNIIVRGGRAKMFTPILAGSNG